MASWKYKRWKIRWQPSQKKFKKIQRNRTKSRKAHLNWRKNRGKMKQALRKARIKGKITQRKNKAKGIYKKLKIARKRWKNLLKSDINLELMMDQTLLSEAILREKYSMPELEVDADSDVKDIISALREIKKNLSMADYDDEKVKEDYIDSAIDNLKDLMGEEDLDKEEEDFIEEIISFIEEFAEEADIIDHSDEESRPINKVPKNKDKE